MYVKANNEAAEKFPYSIGELRKDNPQTSFPRNPKTDLLADWGVYPVTLSDRPQTKPGEKAEQDSEPTFEGGEWVLGWTVRKLTTEEIEQVAVGAREKRNKKLQASDWTQLADAPLDDSEKSDWSQYRQALRDVTAQTGFPTAINWPTEPGA